MLVGQRWRLGLLSAAAASALLAAGAQATPIVDRGAGTGKSAATDLAADAALDASGVSGAAGGEVGTALDLDLDSLLPPALLAGPALIPEPTTLLLVSLGMAGLTFVGRRRAI
jgi:PEP-CTERM motif-containing protein